MPTHSPARWSLVVPVKRLGGAKTRLADLAGPLREDLALAMACDTVEAALECPGVDVLVVTDDARAAVALGGLGVTCIADRPDAGLNPALVHGAEQAHRLHPGGGVGALSADLPALRPHALAAALREAARHPCAFVADGAGTGTTVMLARPGTDLRPRFGPRSRARHAADGCHELTSPALASLRRDVDTEVDLRDALRMGAGARTARVAEELGLHHDGPAPR